MFISFDFDHDEDIKHALIGQSKLPDSPFEVVDWSVKTASTDWRADARRRIKRSDVVIVLCGAHMASANGVDIEVAITREERKPHFLLAGRPTGSTRPRSCVGETMYAWTWPNLKQLIGGAR